MGAFFSTINWSQNEIDYLHLLLDEIEMTSICLPTLSFPYHSRFGICDSLEILDKAGLKFSLINLVIDMRLVVAISFMLLTDIGYLPIAIVFDIMRVHL